MKSFIFTVTESPKRGCNRRITAYRIKRNLPVFLGYEDVNTASFYGNPATARQIIAKAGEATMVDSYNFTQQHSLQEV